MNKTIRAVSALLLTSLCVSAPVLAGTTSKYKKKKPATKPPISLQVSTLTLAPGTPIATSPTQDTIYVDPQKEQQETLRVNATIANSRGQVVVPANSQIIGVFQPAPGGARFIANKVITPDGKTYTIVASSDLIHDQKDPRSSSLGAMAGDAGIGAAGGAAVSAILNGGRLDPLTIAGGAAAGAIVGNVGAKQVVVVDRNQPLNLHLDQTLQVQPQSYYNQPR